MSKKDYGNNLVEAANDAMRAKMPYSELEQKLAALIISEIDPRQHGFKPIRFNTADILDYLKMGRGNYSYLYTITKSLLSNPITIKEPDGSTYISNIIADAIFSPDNDRVEYRVSDKMSEYLLQLDGGYSKFYLTYIIGLRSKYSMSLYRFLKSFQTQVHVTKTIEEMRFSLGLAHEYKNFNDLKRRVLDVAEIEIPQQTDISFSYKVTTKRKKVTHLTFSISANTNLDKKLELAGQKVTLAEMNLAEKRAEAEEITRQKVRQEIRDSLDEAERLRKASDQSLFDDESITPDDQDDRQAPPAGKIGRRPPRQPKNP